jgi:hypothetical protein
LKKVRRRGRVRGEKEGGGLKRSERWKGEEVEEELKEKREGGRGG